MKPDDTYPMPKDGWVCFHCGERFKQYGTARDHFGEAPGKLLQCHALRDDLWALALAARDFTAGTGDGVVYFDELQKALARDNVVDVLREGEKT